MVLVGNMIDGKLWSLLVFLRFTLLFVGKYGKFLVFDGILLVNSSISWKIFVF